MRVDFIINTTPVSKQRPRLGKGGCVYTPSKTKVFENIVALSYGNRPSFNDKYIRIRLKFKFEVPKSYSKKKRLEALEGKIRPTKGDVDNYAKAVLDGLNGVAFKDDRYIYAMETEKIYDIESGIEVVIESIE